MAGRFAGARSTRVGAASGSLTSGDANLGSLAGARRGFARGRCSAGGGRVADGFSFGSGRVSSLAVLDLASPEGRRDGIFGGDAGSGSCARRLAVLPGALSTASAARPASASSRTSA